MNKKILSVVGALGVFAACASPAIAKKQPQLTPMELQSIQSKEFETTKDTLFASAMSVFQDLGYTIESADLATGFITASSPVTDKTNFWGALAGMSSQGLTKGTAFIETLPNGHARIRLNFVNTVESSSAYGQHMRADKPILDPTPYRIAWDKIDEALFVRNAMSKPAPALPTAVASQAAAPAPAPAPAPAAPAAPAAAPASAQPTTAPAGH